MSSDAVYISREMINSKALRELKGNSLKVLLIFLTKRKFSKKSIGRREDYVIANNGEIVFTYREAEKRLGLHKMSFTRVLDQLMTLGFLEIAQKGNGFIKGATTKYSLVERWKQWGTPNFKLIQRDKDNRCSRKNRTQDVSCGGNKMCPE